MATYVIGDVQGCYDELKQLLKQIKFDPKKDTLWFCGDLVNRGPKSLEVLRFVRGLGKSAITVLGNHDLHLIATWKKVDRSEKSNLALAPILNAPDCNKLLNWLRKQPLIYQDPKLGYTMLHAGLPPQWSLKQAHSYAREVELVLGGSQLNAFLNNMYGNKPKKWRDDLTGWERLRFIVNCFTRLRYCKSNGRLDFNYKGKPGSQMKDYKPWFMVKNRQSKSDQIVFGHWSTLGLYQNHNVNGVDTGCLWGGKLTALQIDKKIPKVHQISCKGRILSGR